MPPQALFQTVAIQDHAYKLHDEVKNNNTELSEKLHDMSDDAQLVGAAMLDSLSDQEMSELLHSDRAMEALRYAVTSRAMYLLGRPRVQDYLRQQWRGRLIHQLSTNQVFDPLNSHFEMDSGTKWRLWLLTIFVFMPCNLMLLPLVVLFPSIQKTVPRKLPKIGGRIDPYMPGSVFQKAGYSQKYKFCTPPQPQTLC